MINKKLSNFQKFRYSETYTLIGNGTLAVIGLLVTVHTFGVINGLIGPGTGMGGLLFLLLDVLVIFGFIIVSLSLIVSTLYNNKKHPPKPCRVLLISDIGFILYVVLLAILAVTVFIEYLANF